MLKPAIKPYASAPAPARAVAPAMLAVLVLLAAAPGSPLQAQALPQTPAQYLQTMDLDGDGRISLAEYRDYMSRNFRRMDRNGDGVLTGDELPVPGARPVRLVDYLESLRQAFQRQDLNGDGYLDARELASPPR
ncbi:MAG: EF-hand domain-containing protein [Xanthomonadales bacterium]|nr:EF-hand domain-containing protein [Xanthomonadales bacterium]